MARRGSLVGDAYVRIHADSSAIDRELRRDFNARAKAAGTEAGKEHSNSFFDSWDDEAKARVKKSNEELIRGLVGGRREWDKQFQSSAMPSVDKFVKSAKARIVDLSGTDVSPKNLKKLQAALDDLDKWAKDAKVEERLKKITQSVKDQDAAFRSYASNVKFSEQETKRLEKVILDQDRAWNSYADNVDQSRVAVIKMQKAVKDQDAAFRTYTDNIREGNRIQKEWEKSVARINKAILDQDRAFQSYADNIGRKLPGAFARLRDRLDHDHAMERYAKRTDALIPKALLRLNRSLDDSEHHFGRFATLLGKVFGKGSRNNFFNFVGTVAEGVGKVVTAVTRGLTRVAGFGVTFGHIFGSGLVSIGKGFASLFSGGGFADLGKAVKGIGSGLADLGIQIGLTLAGALKVAIPLAIALAAAMTLISVVIFPLIALVANLAGAIFVLAAEISVALAGALLAAAPLALALAAGIGIAVLAMKDFKKATKEQKKEMKPLTDAWKAFMKVVQGPQVFGKIVKGLALFAPVIKNVLTPLAKGLGTALERVSAEFAAVFTGPRIQPAFKAFITSLPIIFGDLGAALAQFSAGLIEFFQPILPFAERLAKKILELATTFADWAASAQGKNAIADFMDKAWSAASNLWDIIVLAGQALGGLIGIATGDTDKGGGTTVLDSIKTKLQEITDWINSPEGSATLQTFFTNARDTAGELGDAIGKIGGALKEVDWQDASDKANGFLQLIGQITSAFVIFGSDAPLNVKLFELAWLTMGNTLRAVFNNFIYPAIKGIVDGLIAFLSGMSLLFRVLGKTIPGDDPFDQVANSIDGAIVKLAELSHGIKTIPDGSTTITVGLIGPGAQLALSGVRRAQSRAKAQAIQFASGGILTGATMIRPGVEAGEAGREAVVPLDRPLHLVDRSVRALAAFAQGLPISRMASGGVVGSGTTIAPGAINVTVPNSDPILVAEAVLDRLAVSVRI